VSSKLVGVLRRLDPIGLAKQ
jgi:hypothetical protein